MLLQSTISGTPPSDPGLDQQRLFAAGMNDVRELSGRVWSDHNLHDPGVTILELACYALTDLTYRARFPLEDLLATKTNNAENMARQFFTPRQVLHHRAWTKADYRKLLIDLPGVRNAWLRPKQAGYVADLRKGKLRHDDTSIPLAAWERIVELRGIYDVLIEHMDDAAPSAVDAEAKALLHANRSLCIDFTDIVAVQTETYSLCAEIELKSDADPARTAGELLFRVDQHLAPPVVGHDLAAMRRKRHDDGSPYALADIFVGPRLKNGFIDDRELAEADLRTEIRLSDIINLLMEVPGVLAVRDIVVNAMQVDPADNTRKKPVAPADPWRIAVAPGRQPRLDAQAWRLVFRKRGMPTPAKREDVVAEWDAWKEKSRQALETPLDEDVPIPLGRFRDAGSYHSFQQHFPAVYGLSSAGLPPSADPRRLAQALQLKAYLLFFDQVMADFLQQLANVRELFARDPSRIDTYFVQVVKSFKDHGKVYPEHVDEAAIVKALHDLVEGEADAVARRNRVLDHLLARFSEDFRDYVRFLDAGSSTETGKLAIEVKRAFLADLERQDQGSEHGLAYNHALADHVWDTDNVSGLERRLARLLGFEHITRRDLSGSTVQSGEGMFLIENLLLRPAPGDEAFLPICADPSCEGCFDDDPYSFRVQILLPAYSARFADKETGMAFRRFVEETIRIETPAHLLPKICWIDEAAMKQIEGAYHAWLVARAAGIEGERRAKLADLVDALGGAKNVYDPANLRGCGDPANPPFILNRNALGGRKP